MVRECANNSRGTFLKCAEYKSLNLITSRKALASYHRRILFALSLLCGSCCSPSLISEINDPEEADDVACEDSQHGWNEVEVEEDWESQVAPVCSQNTLVHAKKIFCGLIWRFAFEDCQEVKTKRTKDRSERESLENKFQDLLESDIGHDPGDEVIVVMSERCSDKCCECCVSEH